MKKINGKQLAKRMAIAMILGLAAGFGCIVLREYMLGNGYNETWNICCLRISQKKKMQMQ